MSEWFAESRDWLSVNRVIEVDVLTDSEADEWDAVLGESPAGLFAHSIAHRDLLAGELGCEAEYLIAREGGVARGVLPVMWAHDSGGRICNSLPYYGSHGGPVAADPRVRRALIEAWNERATDPGTLAATMVENPFLEGDFPEPACELTDERVNQHTLLPAGGGEDEVMDAISSEARNNVRRAARRGVSVEPDNGAITEVWRVHEETMAGLGAPPRSRAFFEAVAARLDPGDGYDIWVARVADEVAAALLVIRWGGVSECFASGTRAGYRWHNPHAALLFAALVNETRNGARIWNWGGTRRGMEGVYSFKGKWGSRATPYRYFTHLNDRSLLDATPDELLDRFPNFYVLPFSALRPSLA